MASMSKEQRLSPDGGQQRGRRQASSNEDVAGITVGLQHHLTFGPDEVGGRLTPSPHCSPNRPYQPEMSALAREAQDAQVHHQPADHGPLGHFRYDPNHQATFPAVWASSMPGGLEAWPNNFRARVGSSESRNSSSNSAATSPSVTVFPDMTTQPQGLGNLVSGGISHGISSGNETRMGETRMGETRMAETRLGDTFVAVRPFGQHRDHDEKSDDGGAPLWQQQQQQQQQPLFIQRPTVPAAAPIAGVEPARPGPEWRATARPVGNALDSRQTLELPPSRPRGPRSTALTVTPNRGFTIQPPTGPSRGTRTTNTQARAPIQPMMLTTTTTTTTTTSSSAGGGFQPMMAVAEPERRRSSMEAMVIQSQMQDPNKFSTRYHGMHTDSNASAEYLPPSQNCALWLTNLPADVGYSELLGAIRGVGRIWCTYINMPDKIRHHTAAAKVVFFTPEAAHRMLSQSWTKSTMIRGQRIRVSHNRIKYGRNAMTGRMSRVLIITGKQDFVNPDNLRTWFRERFVFQEDDVIELIKAAGRAVCEFRFGSYRCQAQMGKMALEKDRPAGLEKVEFADDPCEVGDNLASYGIAADRIQGRGL